MSLTESLPKTGQRKRIHLEYLDGLRGLAAAQVVAYHTYARVMFTRHDAAAPAWFCHATNWLGYGHYAVAVFIVLSGYCLMIPVANTPNWELRGGLSGFVKRRSRRILPPYYVALVFAILLVVIGVHISPEQSKKLLVSLSPGSVVSHLLLLHNLHPIWSKTIDPPMWSVGMEWQIYFVFALVLLPVLKKLGLAASVITAFAMGLLPQYILPPSYSISWSCPWYIGLFALGMLGAVLNFSVKYARLPWNSPAFWGAATIFLAAIVLTMVTFCPRLVLGGEIMFTPQWLPDVIVGLATMTLICFCTSSLHACESPGEAPFIVKVYQTRPLVFVGTLSYSLYLVHQPLIEGIYQVARRFHLARVPSFFVFFCLVLPVVIAMAYLFHLAFERRFMNQPVQKPQGKIRDLPVSNVTAL